MTKAKKLIVTTSALILFVSVFSLESRAMGIRAPKDTQRPPAATPAPIATSPTPLPSPNTSANSYKALWEGKNADATNWTRYAEQAIELHGSSLLKGTTDIEDFCPMYDRLGHRDQLSFWVELIAAMTKFESGFKPNSRYTESTMGTDPITGKQVVSEGLLQLSYQDENNYKKVLPAGVCDFDFAADQKYALTDVRRSILDPKNNLTCGIGILNRQIERYGKISINSGAYWSVLKPSGKRISDIKTITNSLAFCHN